MIEARASSWWAGLEAGDLHILNQLPISCSYAKIVLLGALGKCSSSADNGPVKFLIRWDPDFRSKNWRRTCAGRLCMSVSRAVSSTSLFDNDRLGRPFRPGGYVNKELCIYQNHFSTDTVG